MTAHRVLGVGLAAAGAALAVAPVAGVAVAAVCTALLRGHDATRARRQREQEREHTVELLVAFALELRAGRGPEAALVAAAADLPSAAPPARPTHPGHLAPPGHPALPGLHGALRAARAGGDVAAALTTGPPGLQALAAAWRVSARSGAPLALAAERLAVAAQAEAAAARELDAALAGPRSSARLLAGLPALGLLLAAGLGADPVHVLLHTPLGAGCLLTGLALDLAGAAWTAALVRNAGRAGAT